MSAAEAAIARPALVELPSGALRLRGFLWRPAGAGPFPGIVYNHGSERRPGAKARLGRFFAARGFVFFVPHRRGHGRSPGTYFRRLLQGLSAPDRNRAVVDELVAQVDDVVAALAYLQTLPFVDRGRLAVAGCSFGGIETVLTAERPVGMRAAVDFAGAAMSWRGNAFLRERLVAAVQRALVPIFFLQAENDFNTEPSRRLAQAMADAGKPHQMKIYPPHGTTRMQGHAGFCGSPPDWAEEVLAFLQANLR
jgi:dienelactone hydrolase